MPSEACSDPEAWPRRQNFDPTSKLCSSTELYFTTYLSMSVTMSKLRLEGETLLQNSITPTTYFQVQLLSGAASYIRITLGGQNFPSTLNSTLRAKFSTHHAHGPLLSPLTCPNYAPTWKLRPANEPLQIQLWRPISKLNHSAQVFSARSNAEITLGGRTFTPTSNSTLREIFDFNCLITIAKLCPDRAETLP
ncbi:hypothetical protein B0H16DRAFT_1472677 [Mycena metata]|uniref:Uncharacterized protein n=1 Tax=Mycena metata TaxID=1033252 RepID=A0AAD7HMC2_9AGAR|nr:hypothetical protein B0H16DRAFT_1472677 [Mycena metata]